MVLEILKNLNLTYEDLNTAEKQYLEDLQKKYAVKEMTLADVKNSISGMIDAIIKEIAGYTSPKSWVGWFFRKKRRIFLDARLHNLIFLRDFIESPEKARKAVEQMLKNITPKNKLNA